MVIKMINTSSKAMLVATARSSVICFNGRLKTTRDNRIMNSRPPSSAGIGSTFISASNNEMTAIIVKTKLKPK